MHVPFYRHDLGSTELEAIGRVLAQPILTTGEVVDQFERRFAQLMGTRHSLAVTSCTGAMQILLQALDIGPGDEVITTSMTFIATATAIMQAGATPVLVDCERDTGNLDAAKVEKAITPRTRAIVPVHLYGQMCDMRTLRTIADRHNLKIVEDCAHCVEGSRDGIRPGQLSNGACFSFFATKNLTCGEGGAIAFNDDSIARKLRLLRLHGMDKTAADRHREGYTHWDMVSFGWKYNMSNIEAAMLIPQLDRLAAKLEARQRLATRYRERLSTLAGLTLPALRPDTIHAWHLFPVWVPNRDEVMAQLKRREIESVVNYRAIHLTTHLGKTLGHGRGDFPNAEWIGDHTVSLPFYPTMDPAAVDYVCDALKEILG